MSLLRTKDGHSALLRYGSGQRGRFAIPIEDPPRAEERAARLRELASDLVSAGMTPERVRVALTIAAEAPTAKDFDDAAKVARGASKAGGKGTAAPARPVTFEDLAEQWTDGTLHRKYPDHVPLKTTAALDAQRFETLGKHVGRVEIARFTLEDAEHAMANLPAGLSPTTRRHYAGLIARLLKLAVYPCRLRESSPLPTGWLPKLKGGKAKAWLYPSEDRQLMECTEVPLHRRLLWGFLAREGMRLGEALDLTWGDVDLERGAVKLDENKTDDPRAWALDAGVVRALRRYKPEGAGKRAAVFPPFVDEHTADQFRAHLRKADIDRAELFERSESRQPIRVHDLRGTFVTLALANGKTETWVADRTGHRSSAMINRYRRAARTAQELGLGELDPLDVAIPEYRPRADSEPPEGVDHRVEQEAMEAEKTGRPQRDSKPNTGRTETQGEPNSRGSCTSWNRSEHSDPPVFHPPGTINVLADPVEQALAKALELASAAGRWADVGLLARELEARRRDRAPAPEGNVIDLDARRRGEP